MQGSLLQTVLTTVWLTTINRMAKTKVSACLTKTCLICCCCFIRHIFLLLAFEASFAFLLASKSSIAVNLMAAVQLGTILFSTLDCKVIPPSLFEFSQMWTENRMEYDRLNHNLVEYNLHLVWTWHIMKPCNYWNYNLSLPTIVYNSKKMSQIKLEHNQLSPAYLPRNVDACGTEVNLIIRLRVKDN